MEIKYSFKDWCIDHDKREWLNLWDYELNKCGPEDVAFRSNKKYYFKCPRGIHESSAKCLNNIVHTIAFKCSKCNSLGQWMIDNLGENAILQYWSSKNHVDPFDISRGSDRKKVWFKCSNEQHPDYDMSPYHFVYGLRCPVCSNHKVIAGINSIQDTNPELVHFFADTSDASKYSLHSGKIAMFKCPRCGYVRSYQIDTFLQYPFRCPKCGDGISYAEKFVHTMLQQLEHTRNFQLYRYKSFDWSQNFVYHNELIKGKRIYDFYLDFELPVIIETHGNQHYENVRFHGASSRRTVEEEQYNDQMKKDIALQNGILPDRYITLDCRKSTMDGMRQAIMNSNLPVILKFAESDIDWSACDLATTTSDIIRVCNLWNSGFKSLKTISEQMNISTSTASNYLRRGDTLGLCEYTPTSCKHIMCMDNGLIFYTKYTCAHLSETLLKVKITSDSIPNISYGKIMSINGLNFQYLTDDEYISILKHEPWRVFDDTYQHTRTMENTII